jgi:hypothetical protein
MSDEIQTCPRRAEGPQYDVQNEDRWETSSWRFTDPAEAKKFNDEEASQKNEEYAKKGQNVTIHSNPRYWLWPGPGPKPRTCSYCGCLNPEDAIRMKRELKFEIERTTKRYKLYMHAPGWGVGTVNVMANMDAGVDPIEALKGQKVEYIYPPLKLYSPHFTDSQWAELLS